MSSRVNMAKMMLSHKEAEDTMLPEVKSTLKFYSWMGLSIYGIRWDSWQKNFLFITSTIARLLMLVYLYFVAPARMQFFDQLYTALRVKPLAVLLFKASMFTTDQHTIVMIVTMIFHSRRLLALLHNKLYLDNYGHQKVSAADESYWAQHLIRFLIMVAFGVFIAMDSLVTSLFDWPKTVSMLLEFGYGYFYMIHFLFLAEMLRLMFKQADLVLDAQLRRLQPLKQNLNKKMIDEIKGNIVELGDALAEYYRIFSLPLWSSLFSFVMLSVTTTSLMFIDVPIYTKIYCTLNEAILFAFYYGISCYSQRLLNKFDRIHITMLDKSIDTNENFYGHIKRLSTATNLHDTISIFEFRIYRPNFKVTCLGNLFTINLQCFAFVCGFVLNYSVLLIQTSL